MIAILKIIARQRTAIYTEPLATDPAEPLFELRVRIENKIAPMTISHIVTTMARTKKVILNTKNWFPETEIEP
jgi:hypothetical protein